MYIKYNVLVYTFYTKKIGEFRLFLKQNWIASIMNCLNHSTSLKYFIKYKVYTFNIQSGDTQK